ncbi:hypothetical protein BdWA1_001192 [Babesia duncani]|uniref:Uncharacterized protein n=1 Tax=Babesia duncani TaxID=323732 RepID=A0AAD9PNS9_9APIC|nr:hypothetical protein BdWA1_003600 [Babesia duncani]KAK2198183.1 hypothetical protein BdWA1_001192 [Babesia duncani]
MDSTLTSGSRQSNNNHAQNSDPLAPEADPSSRAPRATIEGMAGRSSDISWDTRSNFEEDLTRLLNDYGHQSNLMGSFIKKYAIGSTFSAAFSGTDMDLITLAQFWTNQKTSQHSITLQNYQKSQQSDESNTEKQNYNAGELVAIFHQQYCSSWQSKLDIIDRTKTMFELLPQKNVLVHLVDPKTTSLVMISFIYNLKKVAFFGLHNEPSTLVLPAPYFGLTLRNSKESFFEALDMLENQLNLQNTDTNINPKYRLEISYLISELDDILSYIWINDKCFRQYTEPLLLNSYTSYIYGKCSTLIYWYRMRKKYKKMNLGLLLHKLNHVIQLICKTLSHLQLSRDEQQTGNHTVSFGHIALCCVIYSYLYAFLSIPLNLLPWETTNSDKIICTCRFTTRREDKSQQEPITSNSNLNEQDDLQASSSDEGDFGNLFSGNFGAIAADAACVENTRRREVLMSHIIGLLSQDGYNWIKSNEKFVDAIDNYKLNLSWYRRPVFSTVSVGDWNSWPLALAWNYMLISPCGRAWFSWYCKTIQAWKSSSMWAKMPLVLPQTQAPTTACINCLKRLVTMRIRDVVTYMFDLESELKRAMRHNN